MNLADAGLSLLLDPDRLTALVGRPVRATHLRPKPGVTTSAALVDADGRPWGWIRTLTGQARAKAEKARAVSAEVGLSDQLREAELPGRDTVVQWGPLTTDPRLARELAWVARRVGDDPTPAVLRYNPLRRLVLRRGDLVLRITEDRHRHRLEPRARALAKAGVPVVVPWRFSSDDPAPRRPHGGASPRTTVWPWVPGSDASGSTDPGVLHAVGEALGRLHRVPPATVPDLPRRGWAQLRTAAARSVELLEQVAPGAASAAARALAMLPVRDPGPHLPLVVCHGDFSLDQCLVGAGPTGVQITDLDRAALAVPVLDHAVLLATALAADDPVLTAPGALAAYADAYARVTGQRVAVPGPWAAAALLARVAEPWRAQHPGWHAETARRSLLAARLATEPDAWASRLAPERPTGPATGRPTGPAPERPTGPAPESPNGPAPDRPTSVPTTLTDAGGTITVERAWPGRVRDGVRQVTVEGRDRRGRVRAATVLPDGTTRVLAHAEDPRLPALARVAAGGELVVHRAGRRAVVRTQEGYVKVLRPGRAPAVADAGRTGAALARVAGLAAPSVLAADTDTVTLEALPGRCVHELSDLPAWTQVWRAWAGAWTRLQGLGPGGRGAGGLLTHDAADEADVVLTWAGRACDAGLVDDRWVVRARDVADRLRAAGDPARLVPTHRDLHDKQLLWDGSSLGVLDLDTVCLADPVLDPVNLAVHADLRRAQGLWSAPAAAVVVAAARSVAAADRTGSVAAADRTDAAGAGARSGDPDRAELDRWRAAELATVVRLVCVYAFRPRWRRTADRWAEERWAADGCVEERWLGADESSLMAVSPRSPRDRAS